MLKWLSKLLISGNLKFENGQMVLLGEKVFIVPVNYFVEDTEKTFDDKKKMMDIYWASWTAGYRIMKTFVKKYKLRKFEERYKIAMDVLQLAGMGHYETIEFKNKEFTYFKTRNNPLPRKLYPQKFPVCHFIRGANAGGGTWVHEKIMNGIEEKCEAQNKNVCVFLNGTTEVLKKRIKGDMIKQQLPDFDTLLAKEQEFVKKEGDEKIIDF